ncbi:MAG TPA: TniB family NTP-binding protein [Anaerovoracaceae bacterium]|nr:TniB family NTP-binding protein [Anaerovoracaceae bacterium]
MNSNKITEVLSKLADCTVWHPDFERAQHLIMKSISTTAERKDPSSALLTGKSGVGKTRLCKIIERNMGKAYQYDDKSSLKLIRPCVYVEVPADASLKSMTIDILMEILKTAEELKIQKTDINDKIPRPEIERVSVARMETIIIQRLLTLETKLLILDEFHHVADRGQAATKLAICNWLTNFMNKSKVAILVSGSTKILPIVNGVDELSGRFGYRATLKELDYCNEAESPIFLSILAGLQREMISLGKLENYVHLTDQKMYKAIFLATHGNFRLLSYLLNDSFKITLQRDDKSLTTIDFAEACNDLHLCKQHGNPFEMSIKELNDKLNPKLKM